MAIDLNRYVECRNPPKPLSLLPDGAVQRLLDGFCFYLHAGVAILYPKGDTIDFAACAAPQFDRFEPSGGRDWYNSFCAKFRENPVHDGECKEFDAKVAAEYLKNPEKAPDKYDCHMGLIDMTYPLRLCGRTVAVVFAGQMITSDSAIQQKIKEKAETGEIPALKEVLYSLEKCPRRASVDVDGTFAKFQSFGNMLQALLDRLYAEQWEAARRGFLNEVVRELTLEQSQEEWRSTLDNILQDFLQLMGLTGIRVYRRRQSRFERWGQAPKGSESSKENIPARLVAIVPDSVLTPLEKLGGFGLGQEDFKLLQKALGMGERDVRLFAHRHGEQLTPATDVLVAVSGVVTDQDSEFIRDFCETVALRVRVASLVLTLQDERIDFSERVGHVGHTAKTPLQIAVQKIEGLLKVGSLPSPAKQDIGECLRKIKIAKTYIREIYTPPLTRGRRTDLLGLLQGVVKETDDLTKRRECQVKIDVKGVYNPSVRDQGNLDIVFTNLVDNATKYSNPGRVVSIRLMDWGDTAVVEIENTGQGIPQSQIESVCSGHNRWVPANLPELLRRRREGEGLGLTMAIQYVENHGGWVEIYSAPEEEQYQDDTRVHWKTRVTVGLPVVK